jgi:hypothetical protein
MGLKNVGGLYSSGPQERQKHSGEWSVRDAEDDFAVSNTPSS